MNQIITANAAFSFSSKTRYYFAGQYFYAYSYYYGDENTKNLLRPAACPLL